VVASSGRKPRTLGLPVMGGERYAPTAKKQGLPVNAKTPPLFALFAALAVSCGGRTGHPSLPPPEYQEWAAPDAGATAAPASVPLADADAAVHVAGREVHEEADLPVGLR
jgi:hypothetical protein